MTERERYWLLSEIKKSIARIVNENKHGISYIIENDIFTSEQLEDLIQNLKDMVKQNYPSLTFRFDVENDEIEDVIILNISCE